MSEALDIRPSSVTQIIKKLEALGMIRREKSQKDARVTLIILTEKGENSLYFQDKATKSLIDIMFDNFTEEELQAFQVYLDKLGNNLTSPDFLENIQDIFELENNWSTFSSRGAQFNKIREKLFTHESPQKYQFSDRLNQEKFNYRDFSRDIFDSFEKDFKGEK
ncbi:MarR family transcriptional regulator [Streptococcus didelphis]|uniref:MarR family transcriptional regulator n=1 Tax=Streptococcus didelphis TaxID=102886 RepID=A0ABY9LIV6_9STRE|nr:MarR family transcriptional regulator [Streptococcus didelphis]WMB28802.1 MarR family transcriptional regulator [Streptococcus didelphis]